MLSHAGHVVLYSCSLKSESNHHTSKSSLREWRLKIHEAQTLEWCQYINNNLGRISFIILMRMMWARQDFEPPSESHLGSWVCVHTLKMCVHFKDVHWCSASHPACITHESRTAGYMSVSCSLVIANHVLVFCRHICTLSLSLSHKSNSFSAICITINITF